MGEGWQRGAKDSQKVLVPPSRHISTSFQDIIDRLAEHNDQKDTEQYRKISEQLDFATLHDFQIVRRRLKQGFKPFNDAALHHKTKFHKLETSQADSDEVEFLEDLYALLKAAHFRVLSTEEWESACNNDFTFTNPMDVAWNAMDQTMLSRFWQTKQNEFSHAAALSDRVLLMHRGIKLSHARGKFFQEKIDLLVEYLIAEPLQQYVTPLLKKYKIAWRDYWPTIEVVGSRDTGLQKGHGNNLYKPSKRGPPKRDPLLDHENARWVTRKTLRDVMPDSSSVFNHLFKEIKLQEPTFKDAIILYRRNLNNQQKNDTKGSNAQNQQGQYGRNIYIKRFQDIPIADLEMVFPDKTVYLKPVLLIQLMFTIILGLISVLVTLLTSEATWSVLGGILSVVGTRAYQVYSSATLGRQKVLDDITDRLYDQTMDAQDGVIYFLLDQMADQHVKELLLAYFLLLDAQRPITQKQLDKRCEDFLQFGFDEKVDFALENSLPTLCEDGLVTKDNQGLLHAVSLQEAQKLLSKKGSSFFNESNRHFRSNIPTFSKLSSRSLKKYIRPPLAPRTEYSQTTSPLNPQNYPTSQNLSQSHLDPSTKSLSSQISQPGYEGQPGNLGPSLPSSQTQGLSKPEIEYEDGTGPNISSTSGLPETDQPKIDLTQPTGDLRPRVGHGYEGQTNPSAPETLPPLKLAFNPEDSRF